MITSRISELAAACGGRMLNVRNDAVVENIVINDKEVKENCCYCAIKGESYDGCDFVPTAMERGAEVILAERREWDRRYPLIVVDDVKEALLKAAKYYREKEIKRLYAVSGSVGKTTVKDMIHSILAVNGRILKTPENKNNLIGAPLTLLSNSDADTAVIEAGISLNGEMDKLGEMLSPDVAVITNIENMHTETLGNKENIARQKLKLLSYIRPNGKAVLLYDEPLLRSSDPVGYERVYVSASDESADLCLKNCVTEASGTSFDVMYRGRIMYKDIFVPLVGKHNALNALLALAAVLDNVSEDDIRLGLENVKISGMRQKMLEINGNKVILDAYNAGPASCRAALDTFDTLSRSEKSKKRIVVFGSMLELGEISESSHYALGEETGKRTPDALIVYGSEAESIALGAIDAGMNSGSIFHFADGEKSVAINKFEELSREPSVILIKGSRGMRMEEFIEKYL
ncbi:MAG: UDP-N-acetylmuramoyl-tripeptide--D-alanyl-D-alanine ligase [Clostridia bacterium]|nr:UDP-N-acetylmuramoyl-tripeptide--D-alanyl-D-alanine ligase [Clostridia bacterium]